MRTLGDLGPKGEPPGWSNLTVGASQRRPQGPRAPAMVPTGGQGLSQVRALWSPPGNEPWSRWTLKRLCQTMNKEGLAFLWPRRHPLPRRLAGPAPLRAGL